MSLTDEGVLALAEAVAESVAGGTTRRLELQNMNVIDPPRLLAALGAALQRVAPGPSFELQLGPYSEAAASAVNTPLARILGRVSLLSLSFYGGELAVRSRTLRRLEICIEGKTALEQLPWRIDTAPALKSVRLERVSPSEAAPLLVALASDPNLPALRVVDLTVAQDDGFLRTFSYLGRMALANRLQRALAQREQRAGGGAAAGAVALGEWRVEVQREQRGPSSPRLWNGVEMIRASRL